MEGVTVTIILTSYNKPHSVGKAIKSVIDQTYRNWELLIMDDHSDDKTRKIIEQYLPDKRIHYFNSNINDAERYKTTRYATLINQALDMANGKYISYLTDDTVYEPNRLQLMVEYLDGNSNVQVVYSSQKIQELNKNQMVISEQIRRTKGILGKAANIVDHCSVLHRRDIAEKVKNKYGNYWNDNQKYWHNADATFWNRLNQFCLFYPIEDILDTTLKEPYSFQTLNQFMPDWLPDGLVVKGLSDDIYLIDNQSRRKISNGLMSKLKIPMGNIIEIPNPLLYKYELGHPLDKKCKLPNQTLIKSKTSSTIYYIQGNRKCKIQNMSTFDKFHFEKSSVVLLPSKTVHEIKDGPPITSNLIDGPLPDGLVFKKGRKYYISQQQKLHFIEVKVAIRLKINLKKAVLMSNKEFNLFEKGKPLQWRVEYGD